MTFDDAFASVAERARPILDELGLPGTVFVPTRFVDDGIPLYWDGIDRWRGGLHDSELRAATWEQLRDLAESGWEVGSHTIGHPRLTGLDDDALAHELGGSKEAVERATGAACRSIAYPYGDVDDRVAEFALAAGYSAGAALPARWGTESLLEWPRVGVYHEDSQRRFRLKSSPRTRALRTLLRR